MMRTPEPPHEPTPPFASSISAENESAPIQLGAARLGLNNSGFDKFPAIDGLLVATAKVHGLTLVTRNFTQIAVTGVSLLNPFDALTQ